MVDLSNLDAASLSFDAALSVLERGLTSTDGTISTAEICQMLESLATAPNAEKAGAREYIADLTSAHCRSK